MIVLFVDVHPDNSVVKFRICWLHQVVVRVLLVAHCVESLEDEFEEGVQVLGAGARHEDVGVAEADSGGDGQTESGRSEKGLKGVNTLGSIS